MRILPTKQIENQTMKGSALITLADLFLDKERKLREQEVQALEAAKETQDAKQELATIDSNLEWGVAWRDVQGKLAELFDVSLLDILLASWEKYQAIAEYADPTKLKKGERATLESPRV